MDCPGGIAIEPPVIAALKRIEALQPAALERFRREGVVFDKSPMSNPKQTEAERWQDVAFWLYTDLCEANKICRSLLEGEES